MSVTPEKITQVFVKYGEGDDEAFSFFYKYFINDLYAYGRSLGADEKHVMDAVQDVFVKIFHDKPYLKSVEHFKFYLFKSLKNRLYDLFKSKPFSMISDIEGEVLNFSIKTTVLDDIIEEEDREIIRQKIEKLLSILTPIQKEALYLRYVQEFEYAEISEMMGKTQSAIRKLVSQAIQKVRKENNILPMILFIGLLFS
jgi:RNA polymerase sigma factor (sigma-70 family)